MAETLLNRISKKLGNVIITDEWLTGQRGEIVDLQGNYVFRFIDYADSPELREKHITEESQFACPIIACGLVGYWLHKKDDEGTKAIFEGYYALRLKDYEKAHECDDDAWDRDFKKEFVCRYHIPCEKKQIKASEALFAYITESDQKKVKSITENYLKFARTKRKKLYPDEIDSETEISQKDDSDFEILKDWKDNPDLDYYLSDKHWNYHVNQLLYTYLKVRYSGNEVGVYINLALLNGLESTKIDYYQIYGVMFNEAYRLCSYILTTPVPETKITKLEKEATSLCHIKLAAPIISYNILVMTGLLLCFANDRNDAIGRFLNYLSNHNSTHYFGDEFHHFEDYIKIGLSSVAAIMIDSRLQPPGKLRPGYDYKSQDEYLRKNLPWYRISAEKLEKRVEEAEDKTIATKQEQHNNNCQQFFGPISNCTFMMPAATSPSSKQKKSPKLKAKPSGKPMTLKYYVHGNNSMLMKQRRRVDILFRKFTEWKWIDNKTTAADFDAFFEGEPRHCNITWTANSTVLTILLQELLKQTYIERQTRCAAKSLVEQQFNKTANSDRSRLDAISEERIKLTILILDINNPLPEPRGRYGAEEDDIQDAALQEIFAGKLRSTKGI